MIRLENIHKSFGKQTVLSNLSLSVNTGETQVLLGLSGSGKTTVLKLINALLKPDSGGVFFLDKDLSTQNILDVRRQIGYVIQSGGLFPHYTVYQNVAIVPRLLKWPEEKIKERAQLLLKKLDLNPNDYFNKYPNQLSGGQAQRVSLARSLAANPPVLLMDEPFGALDPITRNSIRKEFLELDELKEKTIILVTHDVQEAFEMGDRIAIMHEGNIVQNDTPANLLAKPTDFTLSFIQSELLTLGLKQQGLYDQWNNKLLHGSLQLNDLKKLDL